MSDTQERRLGGLLVRIDRHLCVGFGDCVDEAPEVFELDGEGIAVVREDAEATRERLLDACRACPVDALMLFATNGEQLAP